MMTWDINRDCPQRMDYPYGEDNLYQTGKPEAEYLNLVSSIINS